jgi:DNA-binding NarL/FixJ family response regulator
VAGGQALLDPAVTRRVIQRFATPATAPAGDSRLLGLLTDREVEVMRLVAEGLSNEEIGERLYISPLTAKTHVNRAMAKLNARDRAQLVVQAFRLGLAG